MKTKLLRDATPRCLVMTTIRKIAVAIVGLALFSVVPQASAVTLLDTTQGPDGPINLAVANYDSYFQAIAMPFTSATDAIVTSVEIHIGGTGIVDVGLLWNINGTPSGWVPGADYPVTVTGNFLVTLSSIYWSIGAGSYFLAAIPFPDTQTGWTTSSTLFDVVPYEPMSGGDWVTNPPPTNLPKALITVDVVPLPVALPLFATGLGVLGLLGWRRKRQNQAAA